MGANQFEKKYAVEGSMMTKKQAAWLNEVINNYMETGKKQVTKAALVAYDTDDEKSASVIASENGKRLRRPIELALERVGLTDDFIAKKIKSLTEAQRTQVLRDNGEVKIIKHEDNTTQLQATRLAAQLRDSFPSEKVDITTKEDREIKITIEEDTALKDANKPIDGEVVEEGITTIASDGHNTSD